jgi:hypothetical protein
VPDSTSRQCTSASIAGLSPSVQIGGCRILHHRGPLTVGNEAPAPGSWAHLPSGGGAVGESRQVEHHRCGHVLRVRVLRAGVD